MYAIVDIAGQQFKVEKGNYVYAHRLDAKEGGKVEFDKVLLLDDNGKVNVGAPVIKGAKVTGKVVDVIYFELITDIGYYLYGLTPWKNSMYIPMNFLNLIVIYSLWLTILYTYRDYKSSVISKHPRPSKNKKYVNTFNLYLFSNSR